MNPSYTRVTTISVEGNNDLDTHIRAATDTAIKEGYVLSGVISIVGNPDYSSRTLEAKLIFTKPLGEE